jgi:5-oxopent-3-ene-1,2,5-tricarboxylate decarboxylase / 2-hydroxyhepta-2,4-diene-1,7-dioate isomerase
MSPSALLDVPMDVPPYRLSGTVYGTLLNHRSALTALGEAVNQPPYNGAPQAPVLYVKPRNTLRPNGAAVTVPADAPELEIGACLGLVIGRAACHVSERAALDYVAGFLIVNDISVPHTSYYRPSIRCKARDGFCPLGPQVVARAAVANPDALTLRIYIEGQLAATASTGQMLRGTARLLADVTDFMTLSAGDVLATGVAAPAPRVRAGQRCRIEIDPVGALETHFIGPQP